MRGDGSCQFRAVADQIYRDESLHGEVRRRAVEELRANAARSTPAGLARSPSWAASLPLRVTPACTACASPGAQPHWPQRSAR